MNNQKLHQDFQEEAEIIIIYEEEQAPEPWTVREPIYDKDLPKPGDSDSELGRIRVTTGMVPSPLMRLKSPSSDGGSSERSRNEDETGRISPVPMLEASGKAGKKKGSVYCALDSQTTSDSPLSTADMADVESNVSMDQFDESVSSEEAEAEAAKGFKEFKENISTKADEPVVSEEYTDLKDVQNNVSKVGPIMAMDDIMDDVYHPIPLDKKNAKMYPKANVNVTSSVTPNSMVISNNIGENSNLDLTDHETVNVIEDHVTSYPIGSTTEDHADSHLIATGTDGNLTSHSITDATVNSYPFSTHQGLNTTNSGSINSILPIQRQRLNTPDQEAANLLSQEEGPASHANNTAEVLDTSSQASRIETLESLESPNVESDAEVLDVDSNIASTEEMDTSTKHVSFATTGDEAPALNDHVAAFLASIPANKVNTEMTDSSTVSGSEPWSAASVKEKIYAIESTMNRAAKNECKSVEALRAEDSSVAGVSEDVNVDVLMKNDTDECEVVSYNGGTVKNVNVLAGAGAAIVGAGVATATVASSSSSSFVFKGKPVMVVGPQSQDIKAGNDIKSGHDDINRMDQSGVIKREDKGREIGQMKKSDGVELVDQEDQSEELEQGTFLAASAAPATPETPATPDNLDIASSDLDSVPEQYSPIPVPVEANVLLDTIISSQIPELSDHLKSLGLDSDALMKELASNPNLRNNNSCPDEESDVVNDLVEDSVNFLMFNSDELMKLKSKEEALNQLNSLHNYDETILQEVTGAADQDNRIILLEAKTRNADDLLKQLADLVKELNEEIVKLTDENNGQRIKIKELESKKQ